MKTHPLTLPDIAIVAMTRGMAGAGAGLLLAERLPAEVRRAVGWTLLAVGAATTIPLVLSVLGKRDLNA